MLEYRKGAHSVYDTQYHFVWVTKYRYHVLEGEGEVALRARGYFCATVGAVTEAQIRAYIGVINQRPFPTASRLMTNRVSVTASGGLQPRDFQQASACTVTFSDLVLEPTGFQPVVV